MQRGFQTAFYALHRPNLLKLSTLRDLTVKEVKLESWFVIKINLATGDVLAASNCQSGAKSVAKTHKSKIAPTPAPIFLAT